MGDDHIQPFIGIESLLQRHVVPGELGLSGGLGGENESLPRLLRAGEQRKGKQGADDADEFSNHSPKTRETPSNPEAEAEGFEPPGRCRPTVFKTAAIDHSATPPKSGQR